MQQTVHNSTASTRKLLTGVLVLQGLILLGQWVSPTWTASASAQIPDAGAQRLEQLQELRALNAKMDRLIGILESGKLQVRSATPDDRKDAR
jgi:hypothetical protein